MADQNETRRLGESWQQFHDRLVTQDRMRVQEAALKVQRAQYEEQTRQALAGLRAALKADADRGLDKSAALRHVKPIRPGVLDEKISALAPQADKDRLAKLQADALREYRHHLLLCDPALLDRSQLAELATAARIASTDPDTIQE
jgi:hypothetical protein